MSEEHIGHLLGGVELFEPLSAEELEKIAGGVPAKTFEAGQHVFTPAYRGEIFYLLLEGRVRVYHLNEAGAEATIGVLEAGEMIGEAAFTPRKFRGSYAQAMVPSAKVAFLNRSTLYRLIRREPEVGIRAIELLSERLSLYEKRIADIALKNVRGRLASIILELSEREGIAIGEGRYRISTYYSQEDLATMVGAKRVSVTREFGKLKEAEAVELEGRYIIVKDLDALRQAAS